MKILFVCDGTKNLSQMAAVYLRSINKKDEILSTVTGSKKYVNKFAVEVMKEDELSVENEPVLNVEEYADDAFSYIITLCETAYEEQPFFTGKVHNRSRVRIYNFTMPDNDDNDYILSEYRKIREDIKEKISEFNEKYLKRIDMPEFTFKMPKSVEGRKDLKEVLKRNQN